jgi:predicted dinucleotide-binding enzyme
MKIGTIGAGDVSISIARLALAAGHEVILSNSTGGERLAKIVAGLGKGATAGSISQAAEADIVILAVPWSAIKTALAAAPSWAGRILVDATNPFIEFEPKLVLADLDGVGASEIVAGLAPGARTVKAFNSVTMRNFEKGPKQGNASRVLLVSGDDREAKATVVDLIESFGYATIDLGGLVAGGRMQQAGGPLAGKDILVA